MELYCYTCGVITNWRDGTVIDTETSKTYNAYICRNCGCQEDKELTDILTDHHKCK